MYILDLFLLNLSRQTFLKCPTSKLPESLKDNMLRITKTTFRSPYIDKQKKSRRNCADSP